MGLPDARIFERAGLAAWPGIDVKWDGSWVRRAAGGYTKRANSVQCFDPDDGEVTRTRKIRRNVVEERYKPIIDAIYDRKSSVLMKAQVTYESGEVGVIERTLSVQEA